MSACARCGADAGDVSLCTGCTTGLRVELTDIAGIIPAATLNGLGQDRGDLQASLVNDLYVTMARQDQLTRGPYDPPSRGDSSWSPPINDHITDVLFGLHQVLASWAPSGRSTVDLAVSLLNGLEDLRKHPDVGLLVDQVTTAVHRARRAIDRPHDRRIFLGRCGAQLGPFRYCPEEIYGYPDKEHARCKACDALIRIADRQEWLRAQFDSVLGTAVEIAGFLRTTGMEVTAEMIRGLAHRKRLLRRDRNDRGHPRYQIREVLAALGNRYQRQKVS